MKLLIALPDSSYFMWQMLVQINNLKKFDLDFDTIYLIGRTNLEQHELLTKLGEIDCKCDFHLYDDERERKAYSSSLRPFLVKKFLKEFGEKYKNEHFFYIDPDVIFTKKIKFNDLLNKDIWYLSDTKSYIDSNYIKSKSEELFNEMCEIVDIDPKIVEENDENAGGAQYLINNTTYNFWNKVESDSEDLYLLMQRTSATYSPEHPIQAWTADMWALLWNAWYFKYNTKIIKRFDFSWATDTIDKWDKNGIYHNAGATNDRKDLFVKSNYLNSPFNKDLNYVSDKYCSYNYMKEIKETEINFKNFIF